MIVGLPRVGVFSSLGKLGHIFIAFGLPIDVIVEGKRKGRRKKNLEKRWDIGYFLATI